MKDARSNIVTVAALAVLGFSWETACSGHGDGAEGSSLPSSSASPSPSATTSPALLDGGDIGDDGDGDGGGSGGEASHPGEDAGTTGGATSDGGASGTSGDGTSDSGAVDSGPSNGPPVDGAAPLHFAVTHVNDWATAGQPNTIADPSNGGQLRRLPDNFRRIGNIFFSKQPDPDRSATYNPFNDQWLTLKDIYHVNTDIDLRPSDEGNGQSGVDLNEGGANHGYATQSTGGNPYLTNQWRTSSFAFDGGVLASSAQTFQFFSSIAVTDGTPLDSGGDNGPWNFQIADSLLQIILNGTNGAPACPMIIHCAQGQGRSGSAEAIVAYAFYGVPMDQAIAASVQPNASGWIDDPQASFLEAFAKRNPPGYLASKLPLPCVGD